MKPNEENAGLENNWLLWIITPLNYIFGIGGPIALVVLQTMGKW